MSADGFLRQLPDVDPAETAEWIDSLERWRTGGTAAGQLSSRAAGARAAELGIDNSGLVTTPYINTIAPSAAAVVPRRRGHRTTDPRLHPMERRGHGRPGEPRRRRHRRPPVDVRQLGRAVRRRASTTSSGARTTATPATTSTSRVTPRRASTPAPSSRAASTSRQLDRFRREIGGGGLSSYPHPRLMPDFWEFPTVSMGLGPINSIYQARFNRYLHNRRIDATDCVAGVVLRRRRRVRRARDARLDRARRP